MPFGLAIAHDAMEKLGVAGLDLQRMVPQAFYYLPSVPARTEDGANHYRWRIAVERVEPGSAEVELVFTGQPSWLAGRESYRYTIQDVHGSVLTQGEKPNRDETFITLPPGQAGEQYLITVDFQTEYGHNGSILSRVGLSLPISSAKLREVLVLDDGEQLGRSHYFAQYWFHMPASVSTMRMTIPIDDHRWGDSRTKLHLVELWNPEGKRQWHAHLDYVDAGRPEFIEADVSIAPEHTNRLWRITGAGDFAGPAFAGMDAPRVFSVSPTRWFMPDESLKSLAVE